MFDNKVTKEFFDEFLSIFYNTGKAIAASNSFTL
jgi:hypothetical protein